MVSGGDSLPDSLPERPRLATGSFAVRPALRSRPARLAAFACLYVSFAATLGFLGGAAPIVLRERGASLAAVGLLQLIYLPLGLTFTWALALDRLRLPGLPHRVGWIAATQGVGVAALLALTGGERWPVGALFALALAVSFAFATMDVSMEALVVETVAAPDRPAVTTAKLAGSSVGGLVGTGLLVISYDRLGWHGSFLALAALDALCLVPMLLYPEDALRLAGVPRDASRRGRPRLPSALLGRALLLGLYFGAGSAVASGYSLLLQDLGLSLQSIGVVTGTLGPAINLAATLAVGALMAGAAVISGRAVPAERLVALFAVGIAMSGALLAVAAGLGSAGLATAGVVLGLAASSGLGVPVFNMLYRWAQGANAATDYSLLFGVGFLAAMPARVGGPALAGVIGWPAFFALATTLTVGALWLIARAMGRTRRSDARQPGGAA